MGVVVYESIIEGAQELCQRDKEAFVCAVVEYLYDGREPKLKGAAKGMFVAVRPSLDRRSARSKGGKKGMESRWKTDSKPDNKPITNGITNPVTDPITNPVTDPVAKPEKPDNEKEKEIELEKNLTPCSPPAGGAPGKPYARIVGYLNERAGTAYKPTSEKTRRLIDARLNEGFTVGDFEAVIDKRCAEWLDKTASDGRGMGQYLRPETLFGTKFEGYLNAPKPQASEYEGAW